MPQTVTALHDALLRANERLIRAQADVEELEAVVASAGMPVATAEVSRAVGFTVDVCSNCFSFTMMRSGTCLTCHSCGTTTRCA